MPPEELLGLLQQRPFIPFRKLQAVAFTRRSLT